jgi:hypothetical protein
METHIERHRLRDRVDDKDKEVSEDRIRELFKSRTHKPT